MLLWIILRRFFVRYFGLELVKFNRLSVNMCLCQDAPKQACFLSTCSLLTLLSHSSANAGDWELDRCVWYDAFQDRWVEYVLQIQTCKWSIELYESVRIGLCNLSSSSLHWVTMGNSVAIPQDIIHNIIDAVGDDSHLLKICALESSAFLLPVANTSSLKSLSNLTSEVIQPPSGFINCLSNIWSCQRDHYQWWLELALQNCWPQHVIKSPIPHCHFPTLILLSREYLHQYGVPFSFALEWMQKWTEGRTLDYYMLVHP